jgi:hypothetical protein
MAAEISGIAEKASVRHDASVELRTGRRPAIESEEPAADEAGAVTAALDGPEAVVERRRGRASTFDISFAVTTLVATITAIGAVLTPRGVPAADWIEAVGTPACLCCGLYLTAALGPGDGPEERRRAAGWVAFGAMALGALLVIGSMRGFFVAG